MRNKDNSKPKKSTGYWLQLCDSYFEATITPEEEKALISFLATPESNTPQFNEIKAVMGYIATGKAISHKNSIAARMAPRRITRWAVAASIALLAVAGTLLATQDNSTTAPKEIYIAYVDGKKYTDKDFVLQQMHRTMSRLSNAAHKNTIEEQLGSILCTTH